MSFKFSWPHQAKQVFVTGTFDNWSKSVELNPTGSTAHEKEVQLPETDKKIYYKFVADGEWVHDHTGKTETDHEGNVNNVLYPEDITHPASHSANISSVAPGASTTAMAGDQPLERETSSGLPGAFPETPALTSEDKQLSSKPEEDASAPGAFPATPGLPSTSEEPSYSANPASASASEGARGAVADEKVPEPSTSTSDNIASQTRDEPSLGSSERDTEQGLAASAIAGASAIPGVGAIAQKLKEPSATTDSPSTTSNIAPEHEPYKTSESGAPLLPSPLSPQSEREAAGASMFDLGPKTDNMIPESSMGMGRDVPSSLDAGPTISSVAPQSSTNELAGQQPIEPRGVPTVVSESQEAAQADPEAAANPEAVQEKDKVESELQSKVPEVPATTESGMFGNSESNKGGVAGMVGGGLATAGAAAAGTAYAMRDKAQETTGKDPVASLPQSMQDRLPQSVTNEPAGQQSLGKPAVPSIVSESQQAAQVDPEASANPEALQEKDQVENELQSKVPEAPAAAESGMLGKSENNNGVAGMAAGGLAAAGATAAGTAYAMRDKVHESTGRDPVSALPPSVQESINNMNTSHGYSAPSSQGGADLDSVPQQTAIGKDVTPESGLVGGTSTTAPEAPPIPEPVVTSQKEAHIDPEASAVPEAVQEKSAVEQELLSKVPESEATGEPAPVASSALSSTAPVASSASSAGAPVAATEQSSSGAPQLSDPVSGVAPLSMDEKPAQKSTGLNAPASASAVPASVEKSLAPEATEPMDSRDISPMTNPTSANPIDTAMTQDKPSVTTGTDSSSAPVESKPTAGAPVGTPRTQRPGVETTPSKRGSFIDRIKGTPESTKSTESGASASGKPDKKKGLFGRIKDKLKQ